MSITSPTSKGHPVKGFNRWMSFSRYCKIRDVIDARCAEHKQGTKNETEDSKTQATKKEVCLLSLDVFSGYLGKNFSFNLLVFMNFFYLLFT